MAIYLEQDERDYLLHVLDGKPYAGKPNFVIKKTILDKVNADTQRVEDIGKCDHEFREFVGKKTCCIKCETYPENGGFEWRTADGN